MRRWIAVGSRRGPSLAARAQRPRRAARALADQRQRRAADQHQVRRAPERDVLAEQAVPDVVEREADQREARRRRAAARRRAGAYQSRRDAHAGAAAGCSLRQRDREEAGGEDAEQAGEDEVVRRVGERARVAPVVDVQGDVPVHAEQRDEQRDRRRCRTGSAAQPGRPETRSPKRGERGSSELDAARCGAPMRRARAAPTVTTVAAAGGDDDLVERGAAGRLGAAAAAEISRDGHESYVTPIDVTSNAVATTRCLRCRRDARADDRRAGARAPA